jgi:hypothetical protein
MNQGTSQGSNRLVWILGVALVIALIAIAFLLGRDSRAPAASEVAHEPRIANEGGQLVITNDAPTEARVERQGDQIVISNEGVDEVKAYFAAVDKIQAGPAGMSADAFAQQLASEAAQGKSEGFDQLTTDLERMERELKAITPPEPCRQFHELTISSAAEARSLMRDLKTAFTGGATANVQVLAMRAQEAQVRSKKVEESRKALEQKYGLIR